MPRYALKRGLPPQAGAVGRVIGGGGEEFTAQFERLGGNVRALAKHVERDRRQIYRWIDSHGLRREDGGA